MSHESDKLRNSTRRHRDETAVKKQAKIARSHGLTDKDKVLREPHRLTKHHAMDCGNPDCYLCGNPRKTHKDKLTAQEKRMYQDTEAVTDRHSNGLKKPDDDSV
jgi:hypothetical protein